MSNAHARSVENGVVWLTVDESTDYEITESNHPIAKSQNLHQPVDQSIAEFSMWSFTQNNVASNLHYGRHRPINDPIGMTGFSKRLQHLDHTRKFSIVRGQDGWEVREECDNKVVRKAVYQDWHRVERVRRTFVTTLDDLRKQGWAEV